MFGSVRWSWLRLCGNVIYDGCPLYLHQVMIPGRIGRMDDKLTHLDYPEVMLGKTLISQVINLRGIVYVGFLAKN